MFLIKALPDHFSIGSLDIYFYAICILTGVVIAAWLGLRECKKFRIASDVIYWGLVITLPLAIVGARIWYVLFNISSFHSFGEVLGFQNGQFTGLSGLAIQGGVIFALVTVYFYCKKREVSLWTILDFVAPGFLVGQICGRWGNFFNQELYGPIVKNPNFLKNIPILGNQMYIDGAWRHPVFLYEGCLNAIGLAIMLVARRKFKKLETGDLIGFYLVWYGMVRIPIEILRLNSGVTDPLMLGPIPVSILTSVVFILLGVLFLVLKRTVLAKKYPRVYYQEAIRVAEENHVDTLVFDLDGTLLNTRPLIDASFIHTFTKYFPEHVLSDEELDSFFGPTLQQSFSKYSDDQEKIDEMIAYYREFNLAHHDEMVKAFPGARDMMKTLYKAGYRIAVVSSKKTDLVTHGLEFCKLIDYVDVIIGADDVTKHKPDPEGILKALEELNTIDADMDDSDKKKRPVREREEYMKHAMYFGDTASDIESARAAGIRSCGVLYINHPEIMIDAAPDAVINKLSDIIAICGE